MDSTNKTNTRYPNTPLDFEKKSDLKQQDISDQKTQQENLEQAKNKSASTIKKKPDHLLAGRK